MNKEELESKFEDCFDANTRASEGGYGADTTDRLGLWWAFDPMISEFAKQQAVAFMNWTLESGCSYNCTDENQWTNTVDPYDTITTEQLYDKFIEQQNK